MSTKRDKFSKKDKKYMQLAITLASSRKGLTGDNPSVGCLIVKNDRIISIGQTGFGGRPHAEYNAINNSLEKIKGSTMYVTLEPCNHYGKTPPCTNSIIKSGIREIIYGIDDIDNKVKGKSFRILRNRNIKVKKGLLNKEIRDLYDSYYVNRIKKLPYITGKIAVSKNKLIYSKGSKRITDISSDKFTHYLRYKSDSIMISSKTLNIDNPKLNCRLSGFEKFSPKRIVLDQYLEIKLNSYIIRSVKKNNTIIFHNSLNFKKIKILRKKGIVLIKSKTDNKKLFDLRIIFKKLYALGIRNLLVEGGDKITKNLIENRLIDKFYLFQSAKKLPSTAKKIVFTSFSILNSKYKKKTKMSSKLVKDNITIYKR
tara:strand:+ start:35 stop:1141 length:1107 start_codon:yes stop_codon:yes gene_type:complete